MPQEELLNTPLNAPNQDLKIEPVVTEPVRPQQPISVPVAPLPVQAIQRAPEEEIPLTKENDLSIKGVLKRQRLAVVAEEKRIAYEDIFAPPVLTDAQESILDNGRDGPVDTSFDRAQELIGAGIRTFGSALQHTSVERIGQSIIDQQKEDIRLGGYESKYQNKSIRAVYEEDGVGSVLGRTWELMGENLAASGLALGGGVVAAITAPFSLSAASIVGGATLVTSTTLSVGEVALEFDQKGLEANNAKIIGAGILVALLDRFGAKNVVPKDLLTRMTGDTLVKRLVDKGFVDAAKAVSLQILGKTAWEVGTEITQELVITRTAKSEGATYTRDELIDRFIDVAFVAGGLGGSTATATSAAEVAFATNKLGTSIESVSKIKDIADAVVGKVREVGSNALDSIEESRLEKTGGESSPVFQAIKYSRENASNLSGDVKAAEEFSNNIFDRMVEATNYIASNPDDVSTELRNDFNKLQDIVRIVIETVSARQEQEQGINEDQLALDIQSLVNSGLDQQISSENKQKLASNILYSMRTNDTITEEQAKAAINELDLKGEERTVATDYIRRLKGTSNVNSDIVNGTGDVFTGAKTHAKIINAALLNGDVVGAANSLKRFQVFADYLKLKADSFNKVYRFNRAIKAGKSFPLPKGVTVVSTEENGHISEFTIIDAPNFGLSNDGIGKVWDSRRDGQIRTLANQITKELPTVNSYLAAAQAAFDGSSVQENTQQAAQDTTQAVNKEEDSFSEEVVEEEESNSQEEEEFFNSPPAEEEQTTVTAPIPASAPELSLSQLQDDLKKLEHKIDGLQAGLLDSVKKNKFNQALQYEKTIGVEQENLYALRQKILELQDNNKDNLAPYYLTTFLGIDTDIDLNYLSELYGKAIVSAKYLQSTIWPTSEKEAGDRLRTLDSVLEPKLGVKGAIEPRNLFKTVRNFFGTFRESSNFLNLNSEELATTVSLSNFNKVFVKASYKIIAGLSDDLNTLRPNKRFEEGTDRFQENPLNYLLKSVSINGVNTGYLDPNVLGIMSMAGLEYTATLARSTLINTNSDIKRLLGIDPRASVPVSRLEPFREGVTKAAMADSIGTKVFKALDLKGTDKADENLEARMITALGLTTIDIMQEMGLYTQSSKPKGDLDLVRDLANGTTTAFSEEVVNFIRVKTKLIGESGTEVPINKVTALSKAYSLKNGNKESSISAVLDKLFGIQDSKNFPLLKPAKVGKNATYLRTDVKLPEQVIDDKNYLQSVIWKFKPEIKALFDQSNREETIEALKDVTGYREELSEAPYFLESAKAKNDKILREIEDTILFFDILKESGQEDFYFSYDTYNNSRHGISQSTISPHASKLVRYLIYPTDPSTSESFTQDVTISNQEQIHLFKVAIVQNLGLFGKGKDVDNSTFQETSDLFEKLVGVDSSRRSPIAKAGREVRDGANPIIVAAKYKLEGTIAIDGLIALGSYLKAKKAKKGVFTVTTAIQTDAITSGLIISFLNSGLRTKNSLTKLAAGGVFTTNMTYAEYRKTNKDNYEMLQSAWEVEIKESDASVEGHAKDVVAILGLPERADAKDPVLQGNYFAAIPTLIRGYVNKSIDVLYEGLVNSDASIREETLARVNRIMTLDMTKLGANKPSITSNVQPNGRETALDEYQENKFKRVVEAVYGEALEIALDKLGNEFIEYGEALNEIGNVSFKVYSAFVGDLENKIGRDLITNADRETINNHPITKKLFPRMKYHDTGNGQGIHAFKRNSVRSIGTGTRVVTRYPAGSELNGNKTSSGRITTVSDTEPGVSLVARLIQSQDDAAIRKTAGKYPILHAFDAQYSPILSVGRNTSEYNEGTLSVNQDFSIFDNAVDMVQNIIDTLNVNTPAGDLIRSETRRKDSPLYKVNFRRLLANAKRLQSIIAGDKALLFNEDIVNIDHTGLPGTLVQNKFKGNNELKSEFDLDKAVEDLVNRFKGLQSSSDTDIDPSNFNYSDHDVISGDSAVRIFDTLGIADRLGNAVDSSEHLEHLRDLLEKVIAPSLTKLGDFTLKIRRAGNTNAGLLQDQDLLLNLGINNNNTTINNHGSEKTTFVHELVHAITRFMFDDPKFSPIATAIVKMREATRAHLNTKYNGEPWRMFLSPNTTITSHVYNLQEETQLAKDTYNYVFEQKGFYQATGSNNRSARGIHEFMAFGLTDPRLIAELAEVPFKAARAAAQTFGGRIQNLFLKIIDFMISKVRNTTTTSDKGLIQLVAALNKIETKHSFNTNQLMKSINKIDEIAAGKILEWIFEPIAGYAFKTISQRRGGRLAPVIKGVAVVVGALAQGKDKQVVINGNTIDFSFRDVLNESRKRLRLSKNSLLVYITRSIAGPLNDRDREVEALQAKANLIIDQGRKNINNGAKDHIEQSFINPMDKEDWESLTLSVMKTDLIAAIPGATTEIIPKLIGILLNTNNVRGKRIQALRTELFKYGAEGNFFIKQAKGLGRLIAGSKVVVELQRDNAYMIANAINVVPRPNTSIDRALVEQQVDELATLYAFHNIRPEVNERAAAIFKREHDSSPLANGALEFIGTVVDLKNDALERNFNGDKTHAAKGYIKNIVNPNISVKVARLSEQEELKKLGYKIVSRLPTDALSDPTKDPKALYSTDFSTMLDYNRGILSTTGMRARGTSLTKILTTLDAEKHSYQSAKAAIVRAVKRNQASQSRHINAPDRVIEDGSTMLPIFDTNQNIVDFRYIMADTVKLSVLKQNLRANVLLGAVAGSIEDKVNTGIFNIEALRLLKKDLDENFVKRSDEFIKISARSNKIEHRELYNILPEGTKRDIKKVFGTNAIHIDEEYIDIFFGQRSPSIAQLPYLNHRFVKIAEVIWKEIVSQAKDVIVVKSGVVLFFNIVSNTVLGVLEGIPIEYMVREQLKTARDLNNYMDTRRSLYALRAGLKSAKALGNSAQAATIADKISALETLLANNPVRELIEKGLFQSIIEDIDTESDPYSYSSAISNKINEIADKNRTLSKINDSVRAIGRYTYITDDTSMYKVLLKSTQYSDFIARQVVFKYKTDVLGLDKKETENLVRDLYVNYDVPDHRLVQYMNDTGITMFTKYPMRMLRVILGLLKGRPVEALGLILLEGFTGHNIEDPSDVGLNILNSPFGIVEDAATQTGIETASYFIP